MKATTLIKSILLLTLISSILSLTVPITIQAAQPKQSVVCDQAILHYRRRDADYQGWGLHVWGPTPLVNSITWQTPFEPTSEDDFGLFWVVEMENEADYLNYIIHKGDEKDPGPDQTMSFSDVGCEIWQVQGNPEQFINPDDAIEAMEITITEAPELEMNQAIIHYRRDNEDYDGWGLHIWGPAAVEGVTWTSPLLPAGQDEYGIFWVVDMQEGADHLNYIVHKGDEKDPGSDQTLDFGEKGHEIWLIQGSGEQFTNPETAKQALLTAGIGDIKNKAQAHWITQEHIAWPIEFGPKATYTLHYDPEGAIQVTQSGLIGGDSITLEFVDKDLTSNLASEYPYLATAILLKIPDDHLYKVPDILKGQFAISVTAPNGSILGATALQIPGVLDDLYTTDENLGVVFDGEIPTIRVWAPTAKSVTLHLFPDPAVSNGESIYPMKWDSNTGIWSLTGEPSWKGQYYLYEVEVFVRERGEVVNSLVTDPYSLSLSMNSSRSQIVDLKDPTLIPDHWNDLEKPSLEHPTEIAIYELHVRDFSIRDITVPEEHRGTYMAFTHMDSISMRHLERLAQAGLTHVHLMPVFDIATIDEDKSNWQFVDFDVLASYPTNSEMQQEAVNQIRDQDGYNWGYDPWHYSTPEGGYATNADGYPRIREFRQMVQALNNIGLRVVMDVVYNHTNASGLSEKSVLDKIVPGYYYRLDPNGQVFTSTCCPNTATEHAMMEKLMIDSVLTWATEYKIDGFRFDLMGHHMKENMVNVRTALNSLTLEAHGVDGQSIYLYGEGWDFGEVADNARGINATQLNLGGTGIGTFNDRVRDAIRGGSPFGGHQEQGFSTSLYTDPNQVTQIPQSSQLDRLLTLSDQIRLSLAGNLADYKMVNSEDDLVTGEQIGYNDQPAGYTNEPAENVVYASAHDNETLFDVIQYKAPMTATIEQRVRMQNLALSIVTLSQGVPFFHAGSELLRSKSFDRDSYDSGDWFNHLDYSYEDNNWGIGLPLKDKNESMWPIMSALLVREGIAPSHEHMVANLDHLEEMLRIRKSSPLFHLRTKDQIKEMVIFHNTGSDQIPGLIVMGISDDPDNRLDENYDLIIALFNSSPKTRKITIEDLAASNLTLHPILLNSKDSEVRKASFALGIFTIPGRTTAVFIRENPTSSRDTDNSETQISDDIQPTSDTEAQTPPERIVADEGGIAMWPWIVGGIGLISALFLAITQILPRLRR